MEAGEGGLDLSKTQREVVQKQLIQGKGTKLELPEDNISLEEKLEYKDKAVQRLKEYNLSRPTPYKTEYNYSVIRL